MPFTNWEKKLAGEKVISFVDPTENDEGYYRIKITEKAPNGSGRNILKGWVPVCYFLYDGKLTGNIGAGNENRAMTNDEISAKWTHCCDKPIPYEWYQAIAERGEPWPDITVPDLVMAGPNNEAIPATLDANGGLIPAANREVQRNDNQPPEEVKEEPHVEHARAIDAAIGAALKTVASDEDAARAAGSKNRIGELRLVADKEGKALYEPPRKEYERIYAQWTPMVKRAKAEEDRINKMVLTYQDNKRRKAEQEAEAKRKADAEAAEVERKRLEEEAEANARAADRAIAAGLPEPAPQVTELAPAPAPAPAPVVAPVVPTYGTRKVKEEMKLWVDTVTDWPELFSHFAGNADVQNLLLKLATIDIRAGRPVPGITTVEGLVAPCRTL